MTSRTHLIAAVAASDVPLTLAAEISDVALVVTFEAGGADTRRVVDHEDDVEALWARRCIVGTDQCSNNRLAACIVRSFDQSYNKCTCSHENMLLCLIGLEGWWLHITRLQHGFKFLVMPFLSRPSGFPTCSFCLQHRFN